MDELKVEAQFPKVFVALARIREPLAQWLENAAAAQVPTPSGVVKSGILFRAARQHHAIVGLLALGHFEDALILTRSLFELVLHTEQLTACSSDVDTRATQFLRFCRLELHLESRAMYALHLRRYGGSSDQRIAEADRAAEDEFAGFSYTDRAGKHRWFQNWCAKSVAVMAEESSNAMRRAQYQFLYAKASRFVHGGSTAVFPAIYPEGHPPDVAAAVAHYDDVREQNLRLAASFSSVFLAEIFGTLADRIPGFQPEWLTECVAPLSAEIMAD